jgi:hypothetical protein
MRVRLSSLILAAALAAPAPLVAQTVPPDSTLQTAEGVVREIYRLVSFRPGQQTDWAKVRSLFLPQAVVVLRTSRTATSVFDVDGFIQDFIRFDTLPAVVQNGFTETIVKLNATVLGDIAHIETVYEAAIPNAMRAPQRGVDFWSLVKRDGRWWIASVTNEVLTPQLQLPAELRP